MEYNFDDLAKKSEEKKADDLERRRAKDFEFFILAHAKGNPAIYELFRDKSLDENEA